jgi:hypothetical protein
MGLSHIVTSISVFVTGLLPMSCHKAATQAHANTGPVTTVTITPGSTNTLHSLGEISLTNHCETRVDLGAGKDCLLMPKLVGRSDVELTVSLESHSPAGKTLDLTVTQVTTKSGKPLDIALGDYQISLTPKMQ